jgi:predicted MFS family arabinose efflux permease
VLVPLASAAALLALFTLVEGRFASAPLMPLAILRMPRLRAANLGIALLYSGVFAMWFFLTLYLQQVLHFDPLRAGLSFLPMTLSIVLSSALAPRLVARFGVRSVLATGMFSAAVGLALLTGVGPGGSYLVNELAHGASRLGALSGGYQLALGVGAAICLAGALATVVLLRPEELRSSPDPAPA